MVKFTLIQIFLVCSFLALSQKTKTIYFDENWSKTDPGKASFYREITKENSKFYRVEDYYLNGQIQMKGQYQDKKTFIETGTFTYFDSIGGIEQVTNYVEGKRHGSHAMYYPNGVVSLEVAYFAGQENGRYSEFYENGNKRATANYVDGELVGDLLRFYGSGEELMRISLDQSLSGSCKVFYRDGKMLEEGNFIEGLRDGVWYRYGNSGEVVDSTIYNEIEKRDKFYQDQQAERGKGPWSNVQYRKSIEAVYFHSRYELEDDGSGEVLYLPDVEAMFPGGAKAMKRYISENVNYPLKALKKRMEDRVYAVFIVEKDGSISNIHISEGHRVFHEEVIRLIENMPKWTPGQVNGKLVRARCRLPITFSLN